MNYAALDGVAHLAVYNALMRERQAAKEHARLIQQALPGKVVSHEDSNDVGIESIDAGAVVGGKEVSLR